MNCIYMDGFRGFSDTTIPLQQVNFLVGQNSTGKTSLLGLLDLLSSADFWFGQQFNSETYEFGGFSDIVSANDPKRKTFRIGFCQTRSDTDTSNEPRCFLMEFKQRETVPTISRFTFAQDDWIGTIVARKNDLQYRTDNLEGFCAQTRDSSCLLDRVKTYIQDTTTGFKKIPVQIPFASRRMMANFPEILEILAKDDNAESSISASIPAIEPMVVSLAPIRTKPKRTYEGYPKPFSPEGDHTPYILRRKLSSRSKARTFKLSLEKFGNASGLFGHIGITQFGKDPTGPFEVTVSLGEQSLRINSVGYGVSQALPVVAELLTWGAGTWYSIQQPEVHLHPKAQAAFGDLLFDVATLDEKTLFVETHSDYLIDRFRLNFRESSGPKSQVLFFERTHEGNLVHVLPIEQNGEYPEDQPEQFRAFFLQEQRRLLGI